MEIETFGGIQLVNGDCMDVMRNLPDNAFDLAICDPPYGIGVAGQKNVCAKTQNITEKPMSKRGGTKIPPTRPKSRLNFTNGCWYIMQNRVKESLILIWVRGLFA